MATRQEANNQVEDEVRIPAKMFEWGSGRRRLAVPSDDVSLDVQLFS